MTLRVVAVFLPLFIASCTGADATPGASDRTSPTPAAENPALPAEVLQSDHLRVTGAVLETTNAGPYTYVRLDTAEGEIWAAVNETVLKPGAEVTVGNAMWMERFESKTLNRTFDRILFGSLLTGEETAGLPSGHVPISAAGPPPGGEEVADVKVEKAPGADGRTVAEIFASREALSGKEVVVRGRVVKWNAEILGRNWLHLRDGSGSPEKQDNDITVTTSETVARGDVVTIRGTVVLGKDFTAGYSYPVMIEEAKVVK